MKKIDSSPGEGSEAVLEWTGERFLPSISGQIRYEHLHRYAVCVDLVKGKRVLDIACGEGYGCEMLAGGAAQVVGVDVDGNAIAHASGKYASLENTTFLQGSVDHIPLDSGSVDVVISFETIEHVACHQEMLQEIKRVLTENGLLVISTPDKSVYARFSEDLNEYHVKELHTAEFDALLRPLFKNVTMLGQRMVTCSHLQPVLHTSGILSYDAWTRTGEAALEKSTALMPDPVYMLALCSDVALPTINSSLYMDAANDLFMEGVEKLTWAGSLNTEYQLLAEASAQASAEAQAAQEAHSIAIERMTEEQVKVQTWAMELNQEREVLLEQQNSLLFTAKNLVHLGRMRLPNLPGRVAKKLLSAVKPAQHSQTDSDQSEIQPIASVDEYQQRVAKEAEHFAERADVHDLPEVFHYWSNKYLLPKFEQLGIRGVHEFFADVISATASDADEENKTIVSIGCGNCDIEIAVAKELLSSGFSQFQIECVDLIPEMLERGRAMAIAEGLESYFTFNCSDIISWNPGSATFDIVMANQSLHHFVDLEVLFDKIRDALAPNGVFATMDVIGRNGHMRWPEAMHHIDILWEQMPKRHRYNNLLRRFEDQYENWDCSTEGFEGIRAQDILPLLLERFNFSMFLGYGNLTDIFVDRAFGHNFSLNNPQDLAFVDKVGELDDQLIESGELKPTHIVAIMSNEASECQYFKNLSPEFCVRPPQS